MMRRNGHLSRRRLLGIGALGCIGFGATAFATAFPEAKVVRRSAVAFGTVVTITLVDDGLADIEPALAAAFAAIRAIERAANLFDARSEISRLNRDGNLQSPSSNLATMLGFALRLAAATEGTYDPTVQPVWHAWQTARRNERMPSEDELKAAIVRVDYRKVRMSADNIAFERPGMGMTLNSVAQGHAADRVLAAIAAHGVRHAFIDTGEIGAEGSRADGSMWRVAVASPRSNGRGLGDVPLAPRRFIATSADNACHWTEDFNEHHIVDPSSGHSPRELAEVVVAASSGLVADGLSTAAMVLGAHRTCSLLATIDPGASALFIDKAGRLSATGTEFRHLT